MRFTVKRSEAAARRAPLVLVVGGAVLAAGSVMAAPGLGLRAFSGIVRNDYPIRFALPETRPSGPLAASPGPREAPLAEIAEVAEPVPSTAAEPLAKASPVALAAASTLPVPTVARVAPRSKVTGVMALSYSLAGGANAGDAIEVDKAVSIDGVDVGRVPIRIDGNAKVYAQGKKLAALIAAKSGEKAVPPGLSEDFVSLDALRAMRIGVTYDAIRDRLVLEPPGA
ncbi:hypothetical protein [Novosphingobium sp. Gsoil 351]|uniref:hypothetical protein n=1 Tax=Novosphingobium sp. Gsoil 351 TaxID=2675225 RepID=UPI0012B4471A|nr:hypothetical protein [Novosphingobium sp. Gsoil 351]QGN54365.1 hypothetical protein GKE62_07140 [Novosphingobium sp. Gsoil 351]